MRVRRGRHPKSLERNVVVRRAAEVVELIVRRDRGRVHLVAPAAAAARPATAVAAAEHLDVLRDELCERNLPKLREAELDVLGMLPAGVPDTLRRTLSESFDAAAAVPCP